MSGRGRSGSATTVKVVVTGPFAAGKTTLISTISEIDVVATERPVSDATRSVKAATTVAMDFGRITVEDDLVLHLYGTPGQERFSFMWEVLGEGMIGYVVVVDPVRDGALEEAAGIVRAFEAWPAVPHVVAVNRLTDPDPEHLERVRLAVGVGDDVPVVAFDARARDSVKQVLLVLLDRVLADAVPAARPS